jgi:hypothetical protein
MTATEGVQPSGDKLRKAIKWISEVQIEHPDKNRVEIIREAAIRFNLTPKECLFLEGNFC